MTSENADQLSKLTEPSLENVREPRKLPRYSYTKEFLLSLKDLESCKKLPSGIDESILSELEQAPYQQSSRRNEYGPGQSNRLEGSSSYVRGNQGRWDTRSNESSDREEAQAERDAFTQEPGKRYPNQPRRSWQHSEHDGLLGRPSGYSGNTSQRIRGNAQLHLNKSNEPYQPPRPYKAPFSRRDKSDMVNDETFGSSECPSQDQAEEERRRRELFESMRKEQQQAREKAQKENSDHKKDVDGDIVVRATNSEHSGAVKVKNRDDGPGFPRGDSKFVSHTHQSSARPLVPPGFRNPVVDKNPARIFSEATPSSETTKAGVCDNSNIKDGTTERADNNVKTGNHSTSALCTGELKIISEDVSTHLESVIEKGKASSPRQNFGDPSLFLVSGLEKPPELWLDDSLTGGLSNEKAVETVTNVTSSQDKSTSILDKLFKNANRVNDGSSSNYVEDHVKVDEETWSPTSSQSSKFSRWFLEEKNAPPDDIPSKGLHSLFSHSDKFESQDSTFDKMMVTESSSSHSTAEGNSATDTSLKPNSTTSTQETFYPADKPTTSPSVLTCEDLEQYILAEANVNSSSAQPLASESSSIIENAQPQKADVNNLASQHLLSLLQKGGSKESDARLFSQDFDTKNVQSADECVSSDSAHVAEKSLTLETLFGPSFMKELHSVAAPLSGSVGGAIRTSSNSVEVAEDPFFPMARGPNFDAIGEENLPNTKHEREDHKFHEPWQGFEVSQLERSMSAHTSNIDDRPAEVQLPEEESLILLGDSVNRAGLEPFSVETKVNNNEYSSKTSSNVDGNLSILNSIFNSKRNPSQHGVGGSLHNAAYDIADPSLSHQQLFRGPSFYPNQNSQATPAFQQLGSHPHRNPQLRFMASDTIHQDAHHRFTAGMIPQQSHHTLATQYDPSGHFSISHKMPPAGNFPHNLHFSRGLSPSPSNQLPTHFPEGNSIHGFPLNLQRPPAYGVGMGLPGPGVGNGSGQQETLEWMRAMELRARPKQTHPVGNSHLHGMYGAELDMGFRYR